MAAATAARWLGVEPSDIRATLSSFQSLEHRLEPCGSFRGMSFYNDSDSTTPESTIAGLHSFEPPITLIAGGKNKDLPLGRLAEAVAKRVDVLVTVGESGPQIAGDSRRAVLHFGHNLVIREASSLREAVEEACRLSMPGSTILFSPACASFDMFDNFADRGRQFKKTVTETIVRLRACGHTRDAG
jgi:UDP-N-acetylmuramoylalanine--D-glutamate ligase